VNEKSPDGAPRFEEKHRELEEILRKLERGDLSLDDSIAEYERGIHALRACREILAGAERKIEELVRARDPARAEEPPRVELRTFEHEAWKGERS
jgi:exodeoxyribonuclease VII small subunit